jgi:hypothetical protein
MLLQLLASKLSLLSSSALLQQQQPQDSQLLLTAAAPLPDELLTIVQVGGSAKPFCYIRSTSVCVAPRVFCRPP